MSRFFKTKNFTSKIKMIDIVHLLYDYIEII
jgi:hypothetical protein